MHNTTAGKTYRALSRQSLSTGSWIDEVTVLGATGQGFTEVTVQKNGRPVLFFRAIEVGPNRIQTENALPGTTDWLLANPASLLTVTHTVRVPDPNDPNGFHEEQQTDKQGWPSLDTDNQPDIEGFASATSVNLGETLDLYVDVRNGDATFTIEFYRMGWYGGRGARKMGSTLTQTGGKQPIPGMGTDGLIDCLLPAPANPNGPWTISYSFAIPSDWVSGVYLAKLTTVPSGKQSYIIFVVREDCRSSDFLFQCSVATYQAYNPWGGNSVYPYPRSQACNTYVLSSCAECPFASKVSFNRPYAGPGCDFRLNYGNGAGEFLVMINQFPWLGWEVNMVRWLERQGYDVTYSTSIDTHRGWPANKTIRTFLSVGHDEYWSAPMRANVEAARDRIGVTRHAFAWQRA